MPEKAKPATPIWPSIKRLLSLAGRHKVWLYLAVAADILRVGGVLAFIHFFRKFFDSVVAGNISQFWLYLVLILGFHAVDIPLAYLATRWIGLFSERTLARLREMIASRATVLPFRYLEERHTGDLLSVINADLTKLKTLTSSDLLQLVYQSVMAIGALAYIFSISWQLTLVSTLLTPLLFLVVSVLTAPVSKRTAEMQEEIGKVNSVAQDGLAGVMVVKSFNLIKILDERFHLANRQVLQKGLGIARLRAIVDAVSYAVGMAPFLLAMGYGGYLAITGVMTFGSLLAFINLLNFVANPLTSIPSLMASIGEAAGAAQRIYQLLDQEPERSRGTVLRPQRETETVIRFKDVSFAYEDGNPVLKEVSLAIQKGRTVAVVGPSGGGKSTVLKLILGFYPLPWDRVRLFGDDLNDWGLSAARQQMAFVAQDTYLFPVSIGENIRCGKPGASQAEVEQAARLANIHDFILSLSDGYDTLVGERGARLSGGQRQRISLARAILKDAPILLLDEATSALDTESEALVQEAMDRFMVNRTTVVIAHRLSTIKNADWVLVLDDGRIVQEGTHEELMNYGGLYQDLYQRQFALDEPGQMSAAGS